MRRKIFVTPLAVLLCGIAILGGPLLYAENNQARLGVFVSSQATGGWLGKIYYESPEVECWLDGKVIYKGPVRKGGEKTRIYHGLISSGSHRLKMRWKVRVRGDEAARVKLGGRRMVDWIYAPETGLAEHPFTVEASQTKAIHANVTRKFGLLENESRIDFLEGVWLEDTEIT